MVSTVDVIALWFQHWVVGGPAVILYIILHVFGGCSLVKEFTLSCVTNILRQRLNPLHEVWFVLIWDATTQKGQVKDAGGRTVQPDTSIPSMREAHGFRMPCVACDFTIPCRGVCPRTCDVCSRGGSAYMSWVAERRIQRDETSNQSKVRSAKMVLI